MKNIKFFNWMLVALTVFQFISCENEPLEGQFPMQDNPGNGVAGSFTALVNGVQFTADNTAAIVFADGLFSITGVNAIGNAITLTVPNIGVGNFSLTDIPATDATASFIQLQSATNPYTTDASIGGSGDMVITDFNEMDMNITGAFEFSGRRTALDASGNPVVDGNGDPIIQTVAITQGVFTAIPFILDENGGGTGGGGGDGGGDGMEDPQSEFFANVGGTVNGQTIESAEHEDVTLTTTVNMVGEEMVFKIEATTATGALIRLDIPFDTGIGTFEMESDISDGTKLIGLYNPNLGGENFSSNPGAITFTQFDTAGGVIEGTFNFTGTDPLMAETDVYEITDGEFIVYFEGIPDPDPVLFEAVVDGLEFAPLAADVVISEEIVNDQEIVVVTALFDEKEMVIKFPKNIEVGQYMMSTEIVNGDEKLGTYSPAGTDTVFVSNPGMLTIQNYDLETGDISATFSFTAIDPSGIDPSIRAITEGEFNLNIL